MIVTLDKLLELHKNAVLGALGQKVDDDDIIHFAGYRRMMRQLRLYQAAKRRFVKTIEP